MLVGASIIATCSLPAAAFAQEQSNSPEVAPEDTAPDTATADQTGGGTSQSGTPSAAASAVDGEIVVTGVRASLERARDIKRTSSGVVDAVSAEEIGKFPDTNLAESLQRIPGVSIERRNGEGRGVTVRGFGPAFNLVTVNGRQLATSSIDAVGGDLAVDFARATSRSFDFSNLASEGVSRLEVYKTGRAAIPSGGIGASINVVTSRPLDGRDSGLRGSIGVKGLYDTSLEDFKVTPELTGVLSWSDPTDTFGVSVFGAYQRRESAAASSTVNGWTVRPFSEMSGADQSGDDPETPLVDEGANDTVFTNAPDPDQLVASPDDSRYHYSESKRTRLNLAGTVQVRPLETLTLTADALYARQRLSEDRSDQTNWFATPYDSVTFDDDDVIRTPILITEGSRYATKDIGFEQQRRATKNVLTSFGLNANWEITDGLVLNLDANTSKSKSTPDNPNGTSSTLVGMGAPVVASHEADYSGRVPEQTWVPDDSVTGNGNGVLDLGDLGTQVARTNISRQSHRINQFRADLGWDFGGGARLDIGAAHSRSRMVSARQQTQQALGDWGISFPGDVALLAGDLVEQFCLECRFEDFNATNAEIAFRGNAVDLYEVLSGAYAADGDPFTPGNQPGHPVGITGNDFDRIKERITSVYAQVSWKGEFASRPAQVVGGLRWETTKVDAFGLAPTPNIIWVSDNDFTRPVDLENTTAYEGKGEYTNFLPSIDFRIEPMDNVVARVSLSKTLARPEYNNLFVSPVANAPARPGALGGRPTGSQGNAELKPLVSQNLDLSLEYYYAPSSYVSVGFFAKNVKNFLGTGTFDSPLFDIRDPSSGEPGSRSGIAADELRALGQTIDELNLFTMTALLIQEGNIAAASALYQANIDPSTGGIDLDFAEDVYAAIDIEGDENDPLFNFAVSRPINTRRGKIHGLEIQAQHFFGDSGFGIAASLTKVFGDVKFDRGSDPNENQFALLGLSDSANITGIFEKWGFSARVAYNWRGRFLSQLNRGASRNPVYFEPYGTVDASLGWDVTERFSLSLEGINLLSEPVRTYGRSRRQLWFAQEGQPRILFGARYRFGGGAPAAAPPPPAPVMAPPPPPPPPATQTCSDGSVILATEACPVPPPPPPPPPPAPERG